MQRGATLDGVHVEAGVSGAVPFHERHEGGKLWAELRQGDMLVAPKMDRMFRSASDCLAVVEAFKARGVSLFLLDLNGGTDDVSGNGIARLFLTIVAAFAAFAARPSHRRADQGNQAGAEGARGVPGRGRAPFGFVYDAAKRLQPVPEQQAVLRRIRKLAGDGLSPRKISTTLAMRGVKLSHVTVAKILAGRQSGRTGSAAA